MGLKFQGKVKLVASCLASSISGPWTTFLTEIAIWHPPNLGTRPLSQFANRTFFGRNPEPKCRSEYGSSWDEKKMWKKERRKRFQKSSHFMMMNIDWMTRSPRKKMRVKRVGVSSVAKPEIPHIEAVKDRRVIRNFKPHMTPIAFKLPILNFPNYFELLSLCPILKVD